MCFPFMSEPPVTGDGAIGETRHLTLVSADGIEFAAFLARSAESHGIGIVIMPDVRGLFRFYEELARRFAQAGVDAVAIDYFGRTAGNATRDEAFPYLDHIRQLTATGIQDDVAAALATLRSPDGGSCTSLNTLGFCFGGLNSWAQAANGHGLAGVIGFYGRPGPMKRVPEFACPVLGLFGGADESVPQDQIDAFDAALKQAGVPSEMVVYPGAPHSFFDRTYAEYAAESADSWQRMLRFIEENRLPAA